VGKGEHFAGHDFVEAVDAGDAVAYADDLADLVDGYGLLVVRDLLAENLANFVCLDIRHSRSDGAFCCWSGRSFAAILPWLAGPGTGHYITLFTLFRCQALAHRVQALAQGAVVNGVADADNCAA